MTLQADSDLNLHYAERILVKIVTAHFREKTGKLDLHKY
jgi:hypothetical protein